MAARGFLGGGDLYIARFNPTTSQFGEYEGPFLADKFAIKPNVERREQISKGRNTYGQTIESVALPQPTEFSVTLSEVNKQALTMALLGTQSTVAQGAGTWTNQAVTVTAKDVWLDLGKRNVVAAGFQVQDATNATTYVPGTDYEIDYLQGFLRILPGSAIVAAAVIEVSGGYSAVSTTSIAGATQNEVRARFRLNGINFADKSPVLVTVHEGVLATDSEFDFLSDDFATIELSGTMKTPIGKTEPFVVELPTLA